MNLIARFGDGSNSVKRVQEILKAMDSEKSLDLSRYRNSNLHSK